MADGRRAVDDAGTGRRILVVEDDRQTADLIALYFRHAGHHVAVEHDGRSALARARSEHFDLLILDRMLPGADGLEVCRALTREQGTPVIFVTARTLEDDRITGFGVGADDYVTKPFSPRELVARATAVLRRTAVPSSSVRRIGPLAVDIDRHEVTLDDERLALTPSEFALLEALSDAVGRPRSRLDLLDRMPTERGEIQDRTIDVHVRNLRRKLDAIRPGASALLETVQGVGYRLADPTGARR